MRAPTEHPQTPIKAAQVVVKGSNIKARASLAKVKVTIARASNGNITLKNSHTMPPAELIKRFMLSSYVSSIPSYYWGNLQQCISYSNGNILLKDWARAITAATAYMCSEQNPVECELMAPTTPAYIAMGQTIFRLDPVDFIIGNQKALPLLRRRVLDEAAETKAQILEAAAIRAKEITDAAQNHSNTIQQEIARAQQHLQQLRVEASRTISPPQWLINSSNTLHYHLDNETNIISAHVHFTFFLKITRLIYLFRGGQDHYAILPNTTRIWNARNLPAVLIHLCVPINSDGTYNYRSIYLDPAFGSRSLPHIDSNHCCMELGDAPPVITSIQHLQQLRSSIERIMSTVDLQSMLETLQGWPAAAKRFVPDGPLRQLMLGRTSTTENYASIPCDETITAPPPIVLNALISPPLPTEPSAQSMEDQPVVQPQPELDQPELE